MASSQLFFILLFALVTAESQPSNGTTCDYDSPPASLDCSSQFSGDYYGLGVRLGIYFTWLSSWLANVFVPSEIAGALDANSIFLLSVLISIFYGTASHKLAFIDGLILMQLSAGYLFGCLSLWGYRTSHYAKEGPAGIRHFGRFGTHCRLLLAIAISGYGVWFWVEGIEDGLIRVTDVDGNPRPCQCYPLYVFFFGKLPVLGGIRYLYIVMATGSTIYYGLMMAAAMGERSQHLMKLAGPKRFFQRVHYETGLYPNELAFIYAFLRIGNLIWLIFSAISVELTLNWNHVVEVVGAHTSVATPSQLLPMSIGAFSLIRVIWLVFNDCWLEKEEGEEDDVPAQPVSPHPHRIAHGLKRTSYTVSSVAVPTVQDHDYHFKRRKIHRYLVAWLPWLSQMSVWQDHHRTGIAVSGTDWGKYDKSGRPMPASDNEHEMQETEPCMAVDSPDGSIGKV